jgi:hypothetical protein
MNYYWTRIANELIASIQAKVDIHIFLILFLNIYYSII